MTIKPIYLEPDEEITSVIDKISTLSDRHIAVVVPKNSALFQSLINVKLLAKEAKEHDKEIVIISSNKVGQRLATQVGLKAYAGLGAIPSSPKVADKSSPVVPPVEEDETVDGVKVHRYQPPMIGETAEDGLEPTIGTEAFAAEAAGIASAQTPEKEPVKDVPKDEITQSNFATKELTDSDNNPTESREIAGDKSKDHQTEPESSNQTPTDHEELPTIISRGQSRREPIEFHIPWLALGIALGIIIIISLLAFLFVPRATVAVTFPAKTINQTLSVDVTTSGNNQGLTVTGTQISSDKTVTETINSSGTQDVGTKATGTVTITNEYKDSSGAGKDETLPAGTVIKDTKSGQTFTLDKAVTIGRLTYNSSTGQPIYQSQDDTVTAVSSGSAGNIAATTFTASAALANTVITSSSAFSGGVSKVVKVLTQNDVDSAITDLKNQANSQTTTDLESKAAKKTLLTGSTWQIAQTQSVDHSVGDQTDTAVATYELNVGAIVFDPISVINAVKGKLSRSLDAGQQLILPDSGVTNAFTSLNDAKTDMTISSVIQAYTIVDLSQATLKRSIAGKSVGSMISILKTKYGATDAKVTFKPSWWPTRLPLLTRFITVTYNFKQV